MTDKPRILYVCSAARCGSTITDMFLGGHPQMASLGEINLLGKAIKLDQQCTCGAPLRTCPSWRDVYARIREARGIDMVADPYGFELWNQRARVVVDREHQDAKYEAAFKVRKAWLEVRTRLPAVVRHRLPLPGRLGEALVNKMDLYQAVSQAWQRPVIVDSSKNPWEASELARRWPEQVKVVLLTRDGRGVFLSRRTSGFSHAESVGGWRVYYQRALPLLTREVPAGHLLQLRYEDFASDPDGVGRRLCDFIGVPFAPDMLELSRGERHMVNGNKTRFAPQRGIQLDERWKTQLQGDDLSFFERTGGPMNRRLGYQ